MTVAVPSAVHECPICGSSENSPGFGGCPTCFHCGVCGWIQCHTSDEIVARMKVNRVAFPPQADKEKGK